MARKRIGVIEMVSFDESNVSISMCRWQTEETVQQTGEREPKRETESQRCAASSSRQPTDWYHRHRKTMTAQLLDGTPPLNDWNDWKFDFVIVINSVCLPDWRQLALDFAVWKSEILIFIRITHTFRHLAARLDLMIVEGCCRYVWWLSHLMNDKKEQRFSMLAFSPSWFYRRLQLLTSVVIAFAGSSFKRSGLVQKTHNFLCRATVLLAWAAFKTHLSWGFFNWISRFDIHSFINFHCDRWLQYKSLVSLIEWANIH